MSLLKVENLTLMFDTDEGRIVAVDDVSFELAPGEVLGLVGESGSGKSVTAKSLMKLNPGNAVYSPQSRITLNLESESVDVLSLKTAREMQIVRGGAISMIFQEPMASFAPAITIGDQMDPTVACDMTGNFIIMWSDLSSGQWNTYARRYNVYGYPLTPEFLVHVDSSGDQFIPHLAFDESGEPGPATSLSSPI